jgi:gliding motility-associated lipoprotein GldD
MKKKRIKRKSNSLPFACCLPIIIGMLIAYSLSSCNTNYTVNKKRGFFKIDFPEKKYRLYNQPGYPYTFEYPVYAHVIKDSTFFESKPENEWWINIDFPQFSGRVFISYKEIGKNKFDSLLNDAYTLSYKQHTYKASSIEPTAFRTSNNVDGVYFSLTGNTATANQFFVTDSVKHFLRGALYFDATPNEDSLSVVNDFLKKDLQHLINTLKWK